MKNRKTLLAVLAGLALSSCTTRVTPENDASLVWIPRQLRS